MLANDDLFIPYSIGLTNLLHIYELDSSLMNNSLVLNNSISAISYF